MTSGTLSQALASLFRHHRHALLLLVTLFLSSSEGASSFAFSGPRKTPLPILASSSSASRSSILASSNLQLSAFKSTMVSSLSSSKNDNENVDRSSRIGAFKSRVRNWYQQSMMASSKLFKEDTEEKSKEEGEAPTAKTASMAAKLFFPLSVSFGLGYKIASWTMKRRFRKLISESSTSEGASQAASSLVSPSKTPSISTLVLALVVSRQAWNAVPLWIRRQIPLLGRRYRKNGSSAGADKVDEAQMDGADLTNLSNLSKKLSTLAGLMSNTLDGMSKFDANMAFFVLMRTNALLLEHPSTHSYREERYDNSGHVLQADEITKEMENLDQTFEFADWAYNEIANETSLKAALEDVGCTMIRHDPVALPGSAAHYVAIDQKRKLCIIAIKGTSNFEDFLTDMCGQAVPMKLDAPFSKDYSDKEIYGHEGVYLCACRLADDLEVLIKELLLPADYKLLITGHSLGAGVAAICGIILRSRIPELQNDDESRLRVVAFASPPVLDLKAARACASFTTTVVNNADVITRASFNNLDNAIALVKIVNERLQEKVTDPQERKSIAKYLEVMFNSDDESAIIGAEEMQKALQGIFDAQDLSDPEALFCPGKVIHMYNIFQVKTEESETKNQPHAEDDDKSVIMEKDEVKKVMKVYMGDGAAEALRYIEFEPNMIDDHMSQPYRDSIKAVLSIPKHAKEVS